MKWIWLAIIILSFVGFYIFSTLAFMQEMSFISWFVVVSFGVVLCLICLEFVREYWLQ